MRKGGTGGASTKSGTKFEAIKDLALYLESFKGYKVKDDDVLFNGNTVARICSKYDLYKFANEEFGVDWKDKISTRLVPDQAIYVFGNRTLYIVECKTQSGAGSVDEKLQTCDYKIKQYRKLFKGTGVKVEYAYLLSEWYERDQYKDVKEYIESVGCTYYFKFIPLSRLGLPT